MADTEPLPPFDKTKLKTSEYKRYIYRGKVTGLSAAGYYHAIRPYIQSMQIVESRVWRVEEDSIALKTKMLERVKGVSPDAPASGGMNDKTNEVKDEKYKSTYLRADVKVRITLKDGTVWEAVGDADEHERDAGSILRVAETRAYSRACARILDVTKYDLCEGNESVDEDEPYTPLDHPGVNRRVIGVPRVIGSLSDDEPANDAAMNAIPESKSKSRPSGAPPIDF